MRSLTVDELMEFAKTLEGQLLLTVKHRKQFELHVLDDNKQIEFLIGSPSKSWVESASTIQQFCEEYSRSNSKRVSDYSEGIWSRSYLVALVVRFEKEQPARHSIPSSDKHVWADGERLTDNGYFNSTSEADAYQRVWRELAERRGQSRFREQLIEAYRKRCAVTGCSVIAVLEAAHIRPFCEAQTFAVENGLLLRADIHTLFDLDLLGINPDNLTVSIADSLRGSNYEKLVGKELRLPHDVTLKPATENLQFRWAKFQQR